MEGARCAARDRLAAIAAAEGVSLRAYLARLAETLLTRRACCTAEQAWAALREQNGCAPTPAEEEGLDSELDRRLAQAAAR